MNNSFPNSAVWNLPRRYARWLHTQWPAGGVERLPATADDGTTAIPGVYVVGDLRGIPLLKFAADSGARAVARIVADPSLRAPSSTAPDGRPVLDLVIVGAGVSGIAAAIAAAEAGLDYRILESTEIFSTIANFPKGKPIYTYPRAMTPAGHLQLTASVKEALIDELLEQTREHGIEPITAHVDRVTRHKSRIEVVVSGGEPLFARRVIIALGRSGNFRALGVAGESRDNVYNRLHDPSDFRRRRALVVGGGDSAAETAIALASAGAAVTLSYRGETLSRPKPENIEALESLQATAARTPSGDGESAPGKTTSTASSGGAKLDTRGPGFGGVHLLLASSVETIREGYCDVKTADGRTREIPNDVVFTMIGREAPLDFFRRSGIPILGEWKKRTYVAFVAFLAFCAALYNWKSGGFLGNLFYQHHWFPTSLKDVFAAAAANPASIIGVTVISASSPSFWYTLAYCTVVVIFGVKRIRRRRTPYVRAQTLTLMAIQVLPLFLLPEIILPWLDKNGFLWKPVADALFPAVTYGHGREFWRAYGFVLAWPLNVYNVFTDEPLTWWLVIAFLQTFVAIPALIYFWGKGAYCGWICSCGALAETLGDRHRHKMVHGHRWNRLNMVGQLILVVALLILIVRIYGWVAPNSNANRIFDVSKERYKWIVDVFLAGVIGYGFYFWFSGRVWCRFMCPLAALMHIYTRFSRFRILADKKKCISCNVCTSVCHQGIDIMNFANKGAPMKDPECVRCSACVESCPTGVLTFGQVDRQGRTIKTDSLAASRVQMIEN